MGIAALLCLGGLGAGCGDDDDENNKESGVGLDCDRSPDQCSRCVCLACECDRTCAQGLSAFSDCTAKCDSQDAGSTAACFEICRLEANAGTQFFLSCSGTAHLGPCRESCQT
jgi:hypothetical protein